MFAISEVLFSCELTKRRKPRIIPSPHRHGDTLLVHQILSSIRHRLALIHPERALRFVFRGPALYGQSERNIWHLYLEVFWRSVFSAAVAFNATFALRLGASNRMIGWLSSLPALIAVILRIPAARLLESKSNRVPWMAGGMLIARLGYGFIAVLPWLLATRQAEVLVWVLIATNIPIVLFNAGVTSMLADVIPERDRARVFANRAIIAGAVAAVLTLAAGRWLEAATRIQWASFPVNYQVLYILGFAASLVALTYLIRIKTPARELARRKPKSSLSVPSLVQLKATLTENRDLVRLTVNTLVYKMGVWIVGPLYIILFVRELNASDGWIGLNTTLSSIGVIAGYTLWQRLIRRLGYERTLLTTVLLAPIYAVLVSLVPNLTAILVWGILISLINAGVDLSHQNILITLCPDERRPSYLAVYAVIMNTGAFIGPLIGVALSDMMDIRWVLLIGAGIRLLGGGLFHLFRVQVREVPIR